MKKVSVLQGAMAVLFLCGTADAERTVWYVHPDSALNTIQAGLDSCADNDIVLVGPGTYVENIVWPNTQGIHLISEWGPEYTIIDGNDAGSVIACSAGVDTTTLIKEFTIRNGRAIPEGGGIYCDNHSSPTILGNKIINNLATPEGGGGICCLNNSSPIVVNNQICNNWAVRCGGGVRCINSSPTIVGNTINYNHAEDMGLAIGGGIYCENSSFIIKGNSIIGNSAFGQHAWGGGVGIGDSCFLVITKNDISHNETNGYTPYGGGIWGGDFGNEIYISATIESCTVSHNEPSGIVFVDSGNIRINYCDIYDNSGYGVCNWDATNIIDATYNWWGDSTGPYHPDSNPGGLGDTVSDYVDFVPWLTVVDVEEEDEIIVETNDRGATIFSGPLRLPEGKKCRVFDITGRVVTPEKMRPGVYFLEIDSEIVQKVIKVR